jgi:Iron-containing redox enzyme
MLILGDDLQLRLALRNQLRLRPTHDGGFTPEDLYAEVADRQLEQRFVEGERAAVGAGLRDVPTDPDAFVDWFEGLRERGPGQNDPLFPWLARHATLDDLRWFLAQEVAGEAGFDDLLALTQLRMPTAVKLEMARNFWDEMGRGHASGMHGPMLANLADELSLRVPIEETVTPSLALANLMVALAWNRHYAFQSIGALGVIELTAPGRAAQVNAGLRRLGVAPHARKYFALHATLDIQHAAAWNREVLRPLVAGDSRCARAIAEGALLRLRAGARCFAVYRARLVKASPALASAPGPC